MRERFDIWLADLTPRFGTEPGKTRPVLIVQTNLLNGIHSSTLICPITTRQSFHEKSRLLRIALDTASTGLTKESSVMIDQLRAIDNRRLIKKIGVINTATRMGVEIGLRTVLDLNT